MGNTHEVTVFVWRNGPVNHGRVSGSTGHAAIKIQEVGADKGDYYYLSFWPDKQNANPRTHSMTARHGPGSLKAANEVLENPKKFQSSDFSQEDVAKAKGKPDIKFRFRSLATNQMVEFIKKMSEEGRRFIPQTSNCSNLVAECLASGGAPAYGETRIIPQAWLPNDIEAWCKELHSSGKYSSEMKEGSQT